MKAEIKRAYLLYQQRGLMWLLNGALGELPLVPRLFSNLARFAPSLFEIFCVSVGRARRSIVGRAPRGLGAACAAEPHTQDEQCTDWRTEAIWR